MTGSSLSSHFFHDCESSGGEGLAQTPTKERGSCVLTVTGVRVANAKAVVFHRKAGHFHSHHTA